MESVLAIGVGLVLRIVVDVATDNDDRVGGVLVGLWEGVVLNHFVRRMPGSFDPYLGFGFRVFVDFLFTQSLSRLSLVALWALVGMLLADIAPNVWHDSGLRHLYRQVRKDVRHVKRAVPRIRIENDLPSVRLFGRSRSVSSEASNSIRSDRAAPSRSPAPSPSPTPGPARRPGRSPPGTFPDVSGWSETDTNISGLRERIVTTPGSSLALIPSREDAAYARADATHVATSQTRATAVQDTTIVVTRTQKDSVSLDTVVGVGMLGATIASTSLEPTDDPSRHNPPTIPDDWVEVSHPAPAQPNEPAVLSQPSPSTLTQSRPTSILNPPPVIDTLPDIPDVDPVNRGSQPPDQIPLPESRAASVIGGIYDQPKPRSALRDNLGSHADRAASEIGVGPSKLFVPRGSTRSAASLTRFGLRLPIDGDAPEPPAKETPGKPVDQGKSAAQGSEPRIPTPAQVDPPTNILTQPGDTSPLLFKATEPEPARQQVQQVNKPDQTPAASAGVDNNPVPLQGGDADKGATAGLGKTSLFDVPSPPCSPPPPFSEFAGVPEGPAAGEGPASLDPVTQDEVPTELTEEQKVAEEKRIAFLLTQVQELEGLRANLQKKLEKEDDLKGHPANTIESDLEDTKKTLGAVKARIVKKKFSEPPPTPLIRELSVINKTATEAQFAITSAVVDMVLERDDAGPMTIQVTTSKQKTPNRKAKDARDALNAFANRHKFSTQSETGPPATIDITF